LRPMRPPRNVGGVKMSGTLSTDPTDERAPSASAPQIPGTLESFRNYLTLLVETSFDTSLSSKLEPADFVQETLLKAHQRLEQFRGRNEAELAGWLRQILARNLLDAARRFHLAESREVGRERSLDELLDRSSQRFACVLAASTTTPSQAAQRHERGVALADALAIMEPNSRAVIVLRTLQDLSWDEVARRLGRSPGAARMLWVRALRQLRPLIEARLG
jgi:RNA polymerase sigma-70 factor, ECF subfamily